MRMQTLVFFPEERLECNLSDLSRQFDLIMYKTSYVSYLQDCSKTWDELAYTFMGEDQNVKDFIARLSCSRINAIPIQNTEYLQIAWPKEERIDASASFMTFG